MNCKFCNAELDEGVTLCPACGKENAEEILEEVIPAEEAAEVIEEELAVEEATEEGVEEASEEVAEETAEETTEEAPKKPKAWKIVLAVVGILAALAVLVCAVIYGTGGFDKVVSYTAEDKKAIKARDNVVATVGDMELSNSALQMYYWQAANDFYNNYGYYLDPSVLDFNKPLDEQIYDEETGETWQEYFLENALSVWSRYAALCMLAQEANFELSAEMQANLDSVPEQMEAMAASYGYDSAEAMLVADMGAGCDKNGYLEYVRVNMLASQYLDSLYAEMTPSLEEIETYYNENEAALNAQGIVNDGSRTVDVRHILICPKGGTTDENGQTTYSDAEWEACRAEAQKILDQWNAEGATEELFAQYAIQYTEDYGTASTGGLYQDIPKGKTVEPFETWCFDESRQYGDTGLVQTTYGYHIMFFVESRVIWITNVSDAIVYERSMEMVNEAAEKWPLNANYDKIVMSEVKNEAA